MLVTPEMYKMTSDDILKWVHGQMEVREIVDERRKQRAEPVVVVQKGSTPHQPNRGAWIRETETGDATVAQVASSPLVTVTAQPKPKPKPEAQPSQNTQS